MNEHLHECHLHECHLNDQQLILHYYGEAAPAAEAAHLEGCETCRAAYADLQRLLNTMDAATVPDRGPDYGAEVWSRLSKRWQPRSRTWWLMPPRWVVAAGMALLILGAFLAGRYSRPVTKAPVLVAAGGNRILLHALSDHLERSQRMLVELVNTGGSPGQQEWAERLLEANRLYRQVAASSGEQGIAQLLDQMEMLLLEVAHGDNGTVLDSAQGILFKVRVVENELKEREERYQKGTATL